MTSEKLQKTLEQNRENLKALLDELDADHEIPGNPEKEARLGGFFGNSAEHVKEAEMTAEERAAWLFEENAKAIAAAADAAGVSNMHVKTNATDPLNKHSDLFNPKSERRSGAKNEQG